MNKDGDPPRPKTIYDLAALTGTSASAVSSVLNGSWRKRRISATTAERVTRIAREQGYSVNIQARALRKDRSHIVGMIVPKYDNRYFGAIAERFEARARAEGLFPVITCTQRDPALELEAAREMLAYKADCLVATGATDPDRITALCAAAGVPSLNLDLPGTQAPSVISDNYGGALALSRHLLARCGGDAPLLFVGGRGSDHNTQSRIRGFVDAHAERGLTVPPEGLLTCGYAPQKAVAALAARQAPLPPGLFVNSTITLEGVVGWLDRQPGAAAARYVCFDWDPFAAMLPGNLGMAEQDVDGLVGEVFRMIAAHRRAAPQGSGSAAESPSERPADSPPASQSPRPPGQVLVPCRLHLR